MVKKFSREKIIGEWNETNESIILNKDSSSVFTIGDFVLPTPEEGIIIENMIWVVDDTQRSSSSWFYGVFKTDRIRDETETNSPSNPSFLGQNKIQIRTIFEPSNESTTSPPTLYMGKRPTSFEIESDDQMTLTRQWLLHKREKL